jgi:hypothetical protein
MKKLLLSVASFAVVAVTAMVSAPTTSEAVPSFARQTGAACLSCHFQAIPRLSAFGRNFSMTGLRDMGETALIEDDHLSLPAEYQASFLMKVLVQSQTDAFGVPGSDIAFQIPDESAIFIGGRYGENVGGLTEVSVNAGGAGVAQAKVHYAMDIDNGTVLLTMFAGDVGLGVLTSDPSNAIRHTNRSSIKRAEVLDRGTMIMKAAVSGFAASIFLNDSIYLGGAAYVNAAPGGGTRGSGVASTNPDATDLGQISPYLRAAYIGEFGGMEAILGAWWTNVKPGIGTTASNGVAATAAVNTALSNAGSAKQYGLDLQLQGDVGDLSVGFYLPVVLKGEAVGPVPVPTDNITGFQAMLTVAFGHAGIKLGYDYAKWEKIVTGLQYKKMKRPYVGGWYSVAQNVELEIAYTSAKTDTTTAGVTTGNTVNTTTLVIEYVY